MNLTKTTIDPSRASFLAALLTLSASAHADPPAPKICVAVAGDPDETARAAAETLSVTIGTTDGLRGVADADSRAALRGEPNPAPVTQDITASRRALRGVDADRDTLDPLADRLGCAWFVEVSARPSGLALRLYDVVHHTWQEGREAPSVEPALVTQWLVPATRPSATAAPAARPTSAARATAATRATPAPQRSFLERNWPFFLAGAAAAGVITVFVLTRDEPVGDVQLRVVHGGAR